MDKDATPQFLVGNASEGLDAEGQMSNLPLAIDLLDQLERAKQLDELIRRAVEDALDLLPSQLEAMGALRAGASTTGELTTVLGLVDGTAQPIMESLSKRGLALLLPDGSVSLTEAGNATLDRAEGIRFQVVDIASARLSEHQAKKLTDSLSAVQRLSSAQRLPRA